MMGRQSPQQYKFFLTGFNLDKRIRPEHFLRKISEKDVVFGICLR